MRWFGEVTWGRLLLIGSLIAVLGLFGWGISGLFTPVERAGYPTTSVSPPPAKTAEASPSSDPSASLDPSASPSPSGSLSPSSKPSQAPAGDPNPPSTMASTKKYRWSSLTAPAAGSQGALHHYVVATETTSGLKPNTVAAFVADTLNDPRSWTGSGKVRFALIPQAADADLVIYLVSTKTAAALCGTSDEAAYTCATKTNVVINAERWLKISPTYGKNADGYRRFLINHAIGHALDQKHAKCSKAGATAPVMLQQGISLGGCLANPWPS